jgi:hypothetical protein
MPILSALLQEQRLDRRKIVEFGKTQLKLDHIPAVTLYDRW